MYDVPTPLRDSATHTTERAEVPNGTSYHAYRTTQSRRPRPEPAPDLLARSPDSMRQDFSLGGSFKIFGTTILSPFQCIRNTPSIGWSMDVDRTLVKYDDPRRVRIINM